MRSGAYVAAILALTLAGCGSPRIWAKPGVGVTQVDADYKECATIAENGPATAQGYSDGSVAGSVGAGVGAGISDSIAKYKRRDACLTERGYREIPITSDELAKARSLDGEANAAYRQTLMEKYGMAPRP
ncbi:hypothetical protein GCM10008171_08250 [Methylopila jiangsuensis]|uniref:Lipoprotein n=1 Tax=Methylopila jiangsuensis TaxID=586230 RepID=A0A9W6JDJ3_9HYPH|nr:hypothetical protein [Methylopila jiangsuensis]MDR6285813.1 hypothetical protein [Methylopila jiangsuensis]GLK75571.1 hypothetical protein GCM10008171_08250 [Methylopila jiangsuensis]